MHYSLTKPIPKAIIISEDMFGTKKKPKDYQKKTMLKVKHSGGIMASFSREGRMPSPVSVAAKHDE